MKDEKDPGTLDMFSHPTAIQKRRIKAAADILDNPATDITFQHTVLCQTALPYKDPHDLRVWERRQGVVALRITAGDAYNPRTRQFVDVGLPYGSRPRLITAHLNREALLRGSPRIEVEDTLTAFIRRILDRSPDGREVRRFKDQLSRLTASSFKIAAGLSDEHAAQLDTKIVDVMELWLEKDERQRVLWPAVVELSPRYFDSLTKHAVPLDERAIGALRNNALALDVYCWLAQRLYRIPSRKSQRITWQALYEQFGHGYLQLRFFRRDFLNVLALVQAHYPTAKVEADREGLELRYSFPPVMARLAPVRKLEPPATLW